MKGRKDEVKFWQDLRLRLLSDLASIHDLRPSLLQEPLVR